MPGIGLQDKIKDGMLAMNFCEAKLGSSPSGLGHGLLGSLQTYIIITKFNRRVVASYLQYYTLTAKLLLSLVTFVPLCPRVLNCTHL